MEELRTVDRIEGSIAMCEGEGRVMHEMSLDLLPGGVREGDCLRLRDGVWQIDGEETRRRREQNRARLEKLLGRK